MTKPFDGVLRVESIRGRRGWFNVGKLITDVGEFKVKDKELDQYEPGDYTGMFLVEKIFTASNPWRGGYFTEIIAKIAEGGFLIRKEAAPNTPSNDVQAEPDPIDADPQGQRQAVPEPSSAPPQAAERSDVDPNSVFGPDGDTSPPTENSLELALADLNRRVVLGVEFPDACLQVLKEYPVDIDELREAYDGQDRNFQNPDLALFGLEIYRQFIANDDISLDPTVDREQFRLQRDRLKAAGYRFHAQKQEWRK